MRTRFTAALRIALPAGLLFAGAPAQAQLLDSLKSAVGAGQGSSQGSSQGASQGSGGSAGSLGGLGSLMGGGGGGASSAVGGASSTNIAGLLTFCMKNNYLGGGSAASVKSGLLGKLGGSTDDSSQYSDGEAGKLESGKQSFSLGGAGSGGLKEKITQKVCDQVLKHAKSLI